MSKINSYFDGRLQENANRLFKSENHLHNSSTKQIDLLKQDIYGLRRRLDEEVYSVYPIHVSYSLASFKTAGSQLLNPFTIYADPRRHLISITLRRTGSAPIDVDVCINGGSSSKCVQQPGNYYKRDLTKLILNSQGNSAGSYRDEDEDENKSSGSQKIIIRPSKKTDEWLHVYVKSIRDDPRMKKDETKEENNNILAEIEGYIIVTRAPTQD
jgi:hypothetical protein